jgi:hypothetical protein
MKPAGARTTVTLYPDVVEKIGSEMRRSGASFKETVNSMIRRGFKAAEQKHDKPFKVIPFNLGHHPGLNYDNIGELLEQVEGPDYK